MLSNTTKQWLIANHFNPDNLNQPGRHQDTPLLLACRNGEIEKARELISAGSDVNHRNMDGTTALWACVVSNSMDLAHQLLEQGADIDNQNDNGASALMYASSAGKSQWVKFFLDRGAKTQLKSLDDFTALDLASTIDCLRLLKSAS